MRRVRLPGPLGAVLALDVETFYGPGEPYLVAGLFRVFGAGLGVERAVGFAFRLLLVVGLFVCLRRFGELPALTGGVLAACLVAADGVNADNHVTALALSSAARSPPRRGSPDPAAGSS